MEFYLPHQVRTVREFLVHLVLITLGILIALGLEQLLAAHHRARLGREAVEAFRRELRENRAQVQEMIKAMPTVRAQINGQVALVQGLSPGSKLAAPIVYPNIRFYQVSTASWDTAIATQALNEIPPTEVQRYSAAYGVFGTFMEEERYGLGTWQELVRFGTDAALLTPEQRLRLIEQLNSYAGFTYLVEMLGKGTLQTCDEALR
jgi:hypothetical protein